MQRLEDADYREFAELLRAAVTARAPGAVDSSESDPGIALIGLFAFLTQSLLDRTSQIPERGRSSARVWPGSRWPCQSRCTRRGRTLERPRYFAGPLLGVDDFRLEQDYVGHDCGASIANSSATVWFAGLTCRYNRGIQARENRWWSLPDSRLTRSARRSRFATHRPSACRRMAIVFTSFCFMRRGLLTRSRPRAARNSCAQKNDSRSASIRSRRTMPSPWHACCGRMTGGRSTRISRRCGWPGVDHAPVINRGLPRFAFPGGEETAWSTGQHGQCTERAS